MPDRSGLTPVEQYLVPQVQALRVADDDLSWLHDAACQEVDPETFCLENGIDTATLALMICESCPVRRSCDAMTQRIVEFGEPPTGLVQGGVAHRMRPTRDMAVEEWLETRVSSRNRVFRLRMVIEGMLDQAIPYVPDNLLAQTIVRIEDLRRRFGLRLLRDIPEAFREANERTVAISIRRTQSRLEKAARTVVEEEVAHLQGELSLVHSVD